jgi:transposase
MVGPWLLSVTARRRRRRPSLIDPYERYVLQWWQEGNRNGLQLYRELTAQGYRGSSKAMYRYLERLRTPQRPSLGSSSPSKRQRRKRVLASPAPLENFSAQRAIRLFVCQAEKLDETQQHELALIRQASPSAEAAYRLAQGFLQMIRERTGHQLDAWLSEAEASRLPEFKSFARGIRTATRRRCWQDSRCRWRPGSSRRACEPAQTDQKEHVWPRQASPVASTCASCD